MSLFRNEVIENNRDRLHGNVVFSQPLSTKLLASALFAIICVIAIWVAVGSYSRVETVSGILKTDTPSAKIIARDVGTVSALMVVEGQLVKKGEKLLVVSTEREAAVGGNVAGRSLVSLDSRQELTKTQVTIANELAASERARLEAVVDEAVMEADNLQIQISLQEKLVDSKQEIFDRLTEIVDRGFVSKFNYEERRQALLSSEQVLANLRQRRNTSLSESDQARSQIVSIAIDTRQGIARLESNLELLTGEQAKIQGEQSYVITAPISGRITALEIREGRSASPTRPLMIILPEDATLSAELYAPSRAIGFVTPGKEARLLYDAFPYQRFGSFQGTVVSTSRIAVDPREIDIPFSIEEPVYRIKVELSEQTVDAFGGPAPLQAGMTLQANLVLERQSFLSWLLQPLNAVLNRNS